MLKRGALVFLAAVVAVTLPIRSSSAPSQAPAISAGETNHKNQHQSSDEPQITNGNNAAAKQSTPAPNLVLPPKIEVEIRRTDQECNEKPTGDYIGYALVALGIFVAYLTYRTIGRQASIMEGTLAQMKVDAGSRAVETQSQLKIATDTAQAAQKSADIAERTLTELESPFLYPVIRADTVEAQFKGFVLYDATPGWAAPTITFTIKNFGRTPALVRSVAAEFDQLTEIAANAREGILEDLVVDPVLEPGKETERRFERTIASKVDLDAHKKIAAGQSMLWLYGKVLFSDIFGFEYVQHFSFVYLYPAKRFVPWGSNNRERRGQRNG